MYKVFVVDDEDVVREGIREHIRWEQTKFTYCGEAADGEMAVPLLHELKPDIIITDIRMPFFNGLELAQHVQKTMPWVKVIILSGHDEFQYAKEAIRVNVARYIVKPVNAELLLEALEEVVNIIEQEKQRILQYKDESGQTDFHDATKERFLVEMVSGVYSAKKILQLADENQIGLIAAQYIMLEATIPKKGLATIDGLTSVRSLVRNIFSQLDEVIYFFNGPRQLVLIMKGDAQADLVENAYSIARILQCEFNRFFSFGLSIVIGSACNRLSSLQDSYEDIHRTKYLFFPVDKEITVGVSDIERKNIGRPILEKQLLADGRLRNLSIDGIPSFIDQMFVDEDKNVQSVLYRYYKLMNLFVESARMLKKSGIDSEQVIPELSNPEKIFGYASSEENLVSLVEDILTRVLTELQRKNGVNRYGNIVSKAKQYIENNYSDETVSLITLAKYVGLSTNHFSTVFSHETGTTFIEYLTQVRLNAAKKLLLTTDQRLFEIALAVGYAEPNYFSYLFKKHASISPREYRQKYQGIKKAEQKIT